jgi:aldehyde:ferredoxin oxidoreductase
MDSGGMEWGDAEGAKNLLREIGDGTELGKAIGNGAEATGKRTKHHRVPVVRGQAIPAWDPRSLKGMGVTYATSAMGADHTAGSIVDPGLGEDELAQASQEMQIVSAAVDSSGLCLFRVTSRVDIANYYGMLYGEKVTREQIADMGWQCLLDEWEFNRRAGLSEDGDQMPACMKEDGIGPANATFDVKPEIVIQTYKRFEPREKLFTGADSDA